MRDYHSTELGNVAVLGHSGSGKTSVIEAMAYRCGRISRVGNVKDGNTISDSGDNLPFLLLLFL